MQESFSLEWILAFMTFTKFQLLGKFSKIGFGGSKLKSPSATLLSYILD